MKPIKRKCPICHMPVKVSKVTTIRGTKVRKLYCKKCKLSIRTVQLPNEDEFIYETWLTGKYTKKLDEVIQNATAK